jgi:hypothetical protein
VQKTAKKRHCEPMGRANARRMTGSAKQSIGQQVSVDCFVVMLPCANALRLSQAMTCRYGFAFSPRDPREFCHHIAPSEKQRAQGMPGAPIAPAASRAIKNKAHERSHHGHTGITRHSPRNGFNSL